MNERPIDSPQSSVSPPADLPSKPSESMASTSGNANISWERDIVSKLALASLTEQRRARRWSVFFKSLGFIYVSLIFLMYLRPAGDGFATGKKHTAVIEITGAIGEDENANADAIVTGLRAAFKDKNTAGIILRINSPGGSPVQSGYVNDEIYRLKEQHPEIPLHAVVVDVCASGGYYIAVAADKIFADKASLVGSIGVLMNGFGFVNTMEKLGVERRLLTAGEHKGFLDPFSPQKQSDIDHMRKVLRTTHDQFIAVVKRGRGNRLKEFPELFSGLIWSGEQGLELGLIDGLGSTGYVAREVIGAEDIVDYTHRPDPVSRFAEKFGVTFGNAVASAIGMTISRPDIR